MLYEDDDVIYVIKISRFFFFTIFGTSSTKGAIMGSTRGAEPIPS
jgi:hypothetical protein